MGLLVVLAACGGFGSNNSDAPPAGPDGGTEGGVVPGTPQVSVDANAGTEPFIVQGASATVHVTVTRSGFIGPVVVGLADLPPGCTSSPITIDQTADAGDLVVSTPATLAQGPIKATLSAANDENKTKTAKPIDLFVRGAPGSIDTTFGSGGVTEFAAEPGTFNTAYAIAADSKGGLAIARSVKSTLVVTRLRDDGTPDQTFGTQNVDPSGIGAGVAVSQTGNVVVLVNPNNSSVHRFTPAGLHDPTFGTAGVVVPTYPTSAAHAPRALLVQPDEKVVVVEEGTTEWLVMRLTNAGLPDPTFGAAGNGIVHGQWPYVSTTSPSSAPRAAVLLPSGKIAFGGIAQSGATGSRQDQLAVSMLDANGSLDGSFNSSGSAVLDNGPAANRSGFFIGLGVQPDARLVVAGSIPIGTPLLRRLTTSGASDSTYGTPFIGAGNAIAVTQPDGRLVVVSAAGGAVTVQVERATKDGAKEATFGSGGATSITHALADVVTAKAVTTTDRNIIVLCDYAPAGSGGSQSRTFVVRLWQ